MIYLKRFIKLSLMAFYIIGGMIGIPAAIYFIVTGESYYYRINEMEDWLTK